MSCPHLNFELAVLFAPRLGLQFVGIGGGKASKLRFHPAAHAASRLAASNPQLVLGWREACAVPFCMLCHGRSSDVLASPQLKTLNQIILAGNAIGRT